MDIPPTHLKFTRCLSYVCSDLMQRMTVSHLNDIRYGPRYSTVNPYMKWWHRSAKTENVAPISGHMGLLTVISNCSWCLKESKPFELLLYILHRLWEVEIRDSEVNLGVNERTCKIDNTHEVKDCVLFQLPKCNILVHNYFDHNTESLTDQELKKFSDMIMGLMNQNLSRQVIIDYMYKVKVLDQEQCQRETNTFLSNPLRKLSPYTMVSHAKLNSILRPLLSFDWVQVVLRLSKNQHVGEWGVEEECFFTQWIRCIFTTFESTRFTPENELNPNPITRCMGAYTRDKMPVGKTILDGFATMLLVIRTITRVENDPFTGKTQEKINAYMKALQYIDAFYHVQYQQVDSPGVNSNSNTTGNSSHIVNVPSACNTLSGTMCHVIFLWGLRATHSVWYLSNK